MAALMYIHMTLAVVLAALCVTKVHGAVINPCSTTIDLSGSGSFQLPENYDGRRNEYDDNLDVCWLITAEQNGKVTLEFTNFDVQISRRRQICIYDYVYVYDGDSQSHPQLITKACGAEAPHSVQSSGNKLLVYFHSDKSNGGTGFQAKYYAGLEGSIPRPSGVRCGVPAIPPKTNKVIGGVEATPHSWPWQVKFTGVRCGGSIVSPNYILTAAHCVGHFKKYKSKVVVGAHHYSTTDPQEVNYRISEYIVHPEYDTHVDFNNDIALLKLERPIEQYNDHVMPVCLPEQNERPPNVECVATGWGRMTTASGSNAEVLQQLEVPLISHDVCSQSDWYGSLVNENMICAGFEQGGKDTCRGDSGGPLVCLVDNAYKLFGATSWGLRCALAKKPGVYTNIPNYIHWMAQVTDGEVTP